MLEENKKSEVALREEEILKFWNEKKIFKKSLEKPSPNGNYVFYDGPPFATGLPHHGHILASTIKDVIPRYHTMNGKHVERRWGWDTHGLPIENIVEKNLKISGKKEIEKIGVEKFNKEAREQVLEFVDGWKKTVERIARWVDFDGAYLTMSNDYIESVWWALKEVDKKGLLYEGEKVLPYCPRCETPIANSEIAMDNSYKDITDISVTVKFELVDPSTSLSASEPKTFLLAWTTTPWTLPGNVAAAVNREIEYVKVKIKNEEGLFILAKERLTHTFDELLKKEYEIIETVNAKDLIGKSYKPVFDYYKDKDLKNKENIWKIWNADYVTTEQGTGIVHLAPVYGEEDMALAKEVNLPLIYHVEQNGRFCDEVTDFAGELIKEKDNHQAADIEIIKNLAHREKLFAKEKIIHSYPHCFRCETPLFYNALSAWFIKVQEVKQRALDLNDNINWVPDHLKEGRFKKSMEGAPDWNISRNRYWASPLPFWKSDDGKDVVVLGSLSDLREKTKSTNTYHVMRHGGAESNEKGFVSSDNSVISNLTEKGKEQVRLGADKLKGKNINLIIASPLLRTKQTAEIVAKELGLSVEEDIIIDDRIREIDTGDLNGKNIDEYRSQFSDLEEKMTKPSKGGESVTDMRVRIGEFIYDIDKKYSNKNILIVTHEYAIWMLVANAKGLDKKGTKEIKENHDDFVMTGHVMEYDFSPIPHNENYELDFHRPYIDEITFEENGKSFKRVPEVVDCWVESGSMPFAQKHYPFENEKEFKENFPAQFVAEYIAQTRTWFYYTHILSTILFDNIPFENVVTTGNVMAEDGTKMSKSRNNFPDPFLVFDKYGVDAERYYLLSSPVVQSEDMYFSEKNIDEIYKKLILRLRNVVSFYELNKTKELDSFVFESEKVKNILDKWILSKLNQLNIEVTENMEAYKLDRAIRPIMGFVDDLSTWYVRRSRDRFKEEGEEKQDAIQTLHYVLSNLSKIMAPFTPFVAEDIHLKINKPFDSAPLHEGQDFREQGKEESVHLADWPKAEKVDENILAEMEKLRELVTKALEIRTSTGIKVRQPLAKLTLKDEFLKNKEGLLEILKDELNVKEIAFDRSQTEDLVLDQNITPELKLEGDARELIRFIQSTRKNMKLHQDDNINLIISENAKNLIKIFGNEIKKTTNVVNISYEDKEGSEEVKLSDMTIKILVNK